MKKITTVAAIALFAVAFTSCKKDYTCKCTASGGGVSVEVEYDLKKQTKKDAKKQCDQYVETSNGVTSTCVLN